jgi:ADP-ribose pyrophosphatase
MADELAPWELLRSTPLLQRRPWVAVHQDVVRLPGGRVLNDFYRVELPDYAAVAALTPAGQLVLVRGYKHGLGRISLAVPAGHVEPGEAPLEAARRELLEETGYTAPHWHDLGRFLTDGNRSCGTAYLFLARDAVPAGPPRQDDAEEVRVELVPPECVGSAIREGNIALLPTAATLALALALDPSPATALERAQQAAAALTPAESDLLRRWLDERQRS